MELWEVRVGNGMVVMDIVKLVSLIIGPLVLGGFLIGVVFFLKFGSWREAFSLNPNRGLEKQGLLWISLIVPVLYFTVFGSIAWSGYSLLLTNEGFREFLNISVLPLGFLAMALPVSVLVSRFHATGQTAEQIIKLTLKNDMDMFNSHRKELFTYFDQIGVLQVDGYAPLVEKVHPRIHKDFFVRQKNGMGPTNNLPLFDSVEKDLNAAGANIASMIVHHGSLDQYLTASSLLLTVAAKLGGPQLHSAFTSRAAMIPNIHGNAIQGYYYGLGRTTEELVQMYRWTRTHFINLCDFAGRDFRPAAHGETYAVDSGDYYKTVRVPMVLEHLFATQIRDLINHGIRIESGEHPPLY